MAEEFNFMGPTTFINKPRDVVIRDFQNKYSSRDDALGGHVNAQLTNLLEHVMLSRDIPSDDRDRAIVALHSIAEDANRDGTKGLQVKPRLQEVKGIVSRAADIAVPALTIISKIVELLGVG